jgi:hypothetical protein
VSRSLSGGSKIRLAVDSDGLWWSNVRLKKAKNTGGTVCATVARRSRWGIAISLETPGHADA